MRRKHLLLSSLLLFAVRAQASPVTYGIAVDTTMLAGSTGSLDFNFEPGPFAAQPATVQIRGFGGDGVPVGSALITGDASGSLPGTVQLNNSTGFNDFFQTFKFGSTLSFAIALSGPALTPPAGTLSGSTFAFSVFSDAQGETPALTTDTLDGYALMVDINPNGSTSLVNYATSATVSTPMSTTPEPPSALLVTGPMLLLLILGWRRTLQSSSRC